jgi:cyclic pyranopterin phosphate synthase
VGELRVSVLVDGFGRVHRDLRLSITDRCSLRCTYCLPEEFGAWLPGDRLLSVAEMTLVASVACELGVDSIRLTGGEPLLHPQVVDIVRSLAALPTGPELSLTTNGLRLAALAPDLVEAGLRRVNISIDTLRPERFDAIARRGRLDDVFAGIEAALACGLAPVKLNAVLVRGINDDEAVDLLRFAMSRDLEMRFVEQMPLDAGHGWRREDLVTADETERALRNAFDLAPVPGRGSSPAEVFVVDGGPHRVGIIGSVSRPFCAACDRLRVTADGQVRNCLFAHEESDLLAVLRDRSIDEAQRRAAVAEVLTGSVAGKAAGHGIDDPQFLQPHRPMSAIGG